MRGVADDCNDQGLLLEGLWGGGGGVGDGEEEVGCGAEREHGH